MNVDYPTQAHGSVQSGPIELTANNSVDGSASIESDVLLFEFSDDRGDAVTVEVGLADDQGNGALGSGKTSWSGGDTNTRYVEFSGFGTEPDGSQIESCTYTATLTNDSDPSAGTSVWMNIYRG